MIPLLLLATLAFLIYAVYRAVAKWGVSVLWFLAAGVCLLAITGVLLERLFGPQWSWNFSGAAARAPGFLARNLEQCVLYLSLGVVFRRARRD